jgi:hypothetical protein
MTLH